MARTIILGSGGRLGAALLREWGKAGEDVHGFTRAELDIADADALRQKLSSLEFDVLVNCAAQTNVDRCETHPEEAFRINRDAVREIATVCKEHGARCIHISTDYVFDGAKETPYTEEDPAEPISEYGRSKREGEIALLEADSGNLAVRVSWVFGPDRPSFVDQIVQRAAKEERVEAIADKWATPTYTHDIAVGLLPLLRERQANGILHLCNGDSCSWREYGEYALTCAQEAGLPLRTAKVGGLKMADLKAFIARRPVHTVMSTQRFSLLTGRKPRPWQEAVREYVQSYVAPRLLEQHAGS